MWSVGVSPNGKHLTADVVVPSRRLISSRQTPLKPFWTVLRASARSARPVPGGASGSTWFRFHRGLWTSWKEAEETGIGYQVVGIKLKDGRSFDQVAVSDGCIIEVRGHHNIPFAPEDVASLAINHKDWNFRDWSDAQRLVQVGRF
jgi:hypothetical protein